ncbi:hypothetical protein L211DRAFT_871548 [Terfezia boudieri ATCC MYA-4762]|uniref:Ubiquitin-like protease family profile domain-containing protein n=1 Tax=Terfezia boudieri ATCC MYA-4762 TaxID=1051890 RepID=A0A3N4L7R5_9PEZI|nr:hypothetical protein L211DRAFT_871548 [Terfezia boudieri ATCC MYA-4762]
MAPLPYRTIHVSLYSLEFPYSLEQSLNSNIIQRIQNSFTAEGVKRDLYPIPAELHPDEVPDDEDTVLDIKVSCLHGRHRIAAAKLVVAPADAWWYVDLYHPLTEAERLEFIKGPTVQKSICDGHILKMLLRGDNQWNNLHKAKRKYVDSLRQQRDLWKSLQQLAYLDGLWEDVKIGPLGHLGSIAGLSPQLINYLNAIYGFWSILPEGAVDYATVQYLNLLCPQSLLPSNFYFGIDLETSYQRIWQFLLSHEEIKKKYPPGKQRKDEGIWEENWYQLARLADKEGFRTDIIRHALLNDPDIVAAKSFLGEQAARKGIQYNDAKSVNTIASILSRMNRPRLKPRRDLYSNDAVVDIKYRAGTKVIAPQEVSLRRPPQDEDTGVTVVYVALATFNTFFKLPTYDSAYKASFHGLGGSAEDEPEDMEDTEVSADKSDEDEDMEDTEVLADKSAEDEDMEDTEVSADKSAEDEDIEDTGRVEEVSADKSAEDQYECLNLKRCLNGTTITAYLESTGAHTTITILDSLGPQDYHTGVVKKLQACILKEYPGRSTSRGYAKGPLQSNPWDCGVYLLAMLEKFLQEGSFDILGSFCPDATIYRQVVAERLSRERQAIHQFTRFRFRQLQARSFLKRIMREYPDWDFGQTTRQVWVLVSFHKKYPQLTITEYMVLTVARMCPWVDMQTVQNVLHDNNFGYVASIKALYKRFKPLLESSFEGKEPPHAQALRATTCNYEGANWLRCHWSPLVECIDMEDIFDVKRLSGQTLVGSDATTSKTEEPTPEVFSPPIVDWDSETVFSPPIVDWGSDEDEMKLGHLRQDSPSVVAEMEVREELADSDLASPGDRLGEDANIIGLHNLDIIATIVFKEVPAMKRMWDIKWTKFINEVYKHRPRGTRTTSTLLRYNFYLIDSRYYLVYHTVIECPEEMCSAFIHQEVVRDRHYWLQDLGNYSRSFTYTEGLQQGLAKRAFILRITPQSGRKRTMHPNDSESEEQPKLKKGKCEEKEMGGKGRVKGKKSCGIERVNWK